MKSIIKRVSVSLMVFMVILTVCGSINRASAYELTETAEGRVLKISTAELYESCVKNKKSDRLIVVGKIAKSVFWFIEDLECEVLDLSDLEIDVIPHQSFIENVNLKKVILPKNLKEIEFNCFSGCYRLETVVLPDSLKKIGYGSFQCCPKLKMQVPSTVKVTDGEFYGSPGATIVEADADPVCGCWTRMWEWLEDLKEKTF